MQTLYDCYSIREKEKYDPSYICCGFCPRLPNVFYGKYTAPKECYRCPNNNCASCSGVPDAFKCNNLPAPDTAFVLNRKSNCEYVWTDNKIALKFVGVADRNYLPLCLKKTMAFTEFNIVWKVYPGGFLSAGYCSFNSKSLKVNFYMKGVMKDSLCGIGFEINNCDLCEEVTS